MLDTMRQIFVEADFITKWILIWSMAPILTAVVLPAVILWDKIKKRVK